MREIRTLSDYQEFSRRCRTVRDRAYSRVRREAESVVGMPFHGCAWHNAAISWEAGRPWQEFGREAYRAYKRMQWQEREISARMDAIERSAYDKFIRRERERFKATA